MSVKKRESLDVYKNIDSSIGIPSQQLRETEALVYSTFESMGDELLHSLFGTDDVHVPTDYIIALSIALGVHQNKNISVALALTIPQSLIDEYNQALPSVTATEMKQASLFTEAFINKVVASKFVEDGDKDELSRLKHVSTVFYFQFQNSEKNKSLSLTQWLSSGDIGQSSHFMVSVLSPEISIIELAVPYDKSDFMRCEKALKMMPSLRKELPKMKLFHPAWEKLVDNWDELKKLNAAKKYGEFNSLLKNSIGK
tara:strand:- start:1745 stop:2509 length:765 start_codon:yes stop_codon:yes gene_type:complete